MKKLLLIICLFVLTTSFHSANLSTTWAGNANNQALTKAAFLNGIQTQEALSMSIVSYTLTASQELITKQEVVELITWQCLNQNTNWGATGSSQTVTKGDISVRVILSVSSGGPCFQGGGGQQSAYYAAHTGVIYSDALMTTVFVGSGSYYYVTYCFGNASWQINSSGQITATCAP